MAKEEKKGFVKEFQEFISQGNAMDLAVGVVIGTAFSAIVNSIVNDIVMPVVGLLVGGVDFTNLKIVIPNFFGGNTAAIIAYGNFIQNVVNFVIIALSLFLAIKTINTMNRRTKEAAEKAAKLAKEKAKTAKATRARKK